MSKSSLFSFKETKNHVSRNGFDLSNKNAFTAKCGELLPVYFKNVLPGDKFSLKVDHFTRTQAVQTAAYTRFKETFSWHFVPFRLLWRFFPSVVNRIGSQINSSSSLFQGISLDTRIPYIRLSQLCSAKGSILYYLSHGSSHNDNIAGLSLAHTSAKLLSYLGYGFISDSFIDSITPLDSHVATNPYSYDMNVSPFPLLAYQKIYQDHFRNSQWENLNASSFNVDFVGDPNNANADYNLFKSGVPAKNAATTGFYTQGFHVLRYANWRKDMIMGVLPNSQYGDVSLVDVESSGKTSGKFNIPAAISAVTAGGKALQTRNVTDIPNVGSATVLGSSDGSLNSGKDLLVETRYPLPINVELQAQIRGSFDVLQLRRAQALQKLREVTQSHDLTIKDQMDAHWNVTIPDTLSLESTFIGSSDNNIDINEVVNTNLYGSSDNGQATIAGKGTGFDNSPSFDFESKEHGILMCIYHCIPLLDYENIGIDKQLVASDISDFPTPEFDRLGLDVLPAFVLQNSTGTSLLWDKFLGYTSRYIDYKTSLDKVNGSFLVGDLQSWNAPISRNYLNNFKTSALDYRFFKVLPQITDPLFKLGVDNSVISDPLLINANFDVKVVRNLDYSGMPY